MSIYHASLPSTLKLCYYNILKTFTDRKNYGRFYDILIEAKNIDHYLSKLDIEQIKTLCKPLQDHFGLTSFVYRKNYNDGTEINISNQPEWVKHFYTNEELIKESVFDKHLDYYQDGYVLWSQND